MPIPTTLDKNFTTALLESLHADLTSKNQQANNQNTQALQDSLSEIVQADDLQCALNTYLTDEQQQALFLLEPKMLHVFCIYLPKNRWSILNSCFNHPNGYQHVAKAIASKNLNDTTGLAILADSINNTIDSHALHKILLDLAQHTDGQQAIETVISEQSSQGSTALSSIGHAQSHGDEFVFQTTLRILGKTEVGRGQLANAIVKKDNYQDTTLHIIFKSAHEDAICLLLANLRSSNLGQDQLAAGLASRNGYDETPALELLKRYPRMFKHAIDILPRTEKVADLIERMLSIRNIAGKTIIELLYGSGKSALPKIALLLTYSKQGRIKLRSLLEQRQLFDVISKEPTTLQALLKRAIKKGDFKLYCCLSPKLKECLDKNALSKQKYSFLHITRLTSYILRDPTHRTTNNLLVKITSYIHTISGDPAVREVIDSLSDISLNNAEPFPWSINRLFFETPIKRSKFRDEIVKALNARLVASNAESATATTEYSPLP